mgnify:CR=1 FL=1
MRYIGDYRLEPPDICDRDESEDCPLCERGFIDIFDTSDHLPTYDEAIADNWHSDHEKCKACDGTGTVWPEPIEYEYEGEWS